jgi:hypothetical protein
VLLGLAAFDAHQVTARGGRRTVTGEESLKDRTPTPTQPVHDSSAGCRRRWPCAASSEAAQVWRLCAVARSAFSRRLPVPPDRIVMLRLAAGRRRAARVAAVWMLLGG